MTSITNKIWNALPYPTDRAGQLTFWALLLATPLMIIFPIRTDNISFILLAFIPTFYFFVNAFWVRQPIPLSYLDLFWGAFVLMGFLSFFWANDGALVWYRGFGWTAYFLWMLMIRTMAVDAYNRQLLLKWLNLVFIYSLLFVFIILAVNKFDTHIPYPADVGEFWLKYFGNNGNVTALHLVLLFPFFLLTERAFTGFKYTRLVTILLLMPILYLSSARGAVIGLLFILIFFLLDTLPRKLIKNLMIVLATAVLFFSITLGLGIFRLEEIPVFGDLGYLGDLKRLQLMKLSWLLFLEYPLEGVGLGNWITEVLRFDTEGSVLGDFYFAAISRPSSHNLYTELLAELGIAGITLLFIPFIILLRKVFFDTNRLSSLHKAALISIGVYLIVISVNRIATFYPLFFSKVQLIAFYGLGILTSYHGNLKKLKLSPLLGLISLLSLIWFLDAKVKHDRFLAIDKLVWDKPADAITQFSQLYSPTFYSTYGVERFIPFRLAQLHHYQGNIEAASDWYQKAVSKWPYDERLLMSYARFLLRCTDDITEVEKIVNRLASMHTTYYFIPPLQAELALKKGDLKKCRDLLAMPRGYGLDFYSSKFVSILLLKKDYLKEIIALSAATEAKLDSVLKKEDFIELDRRILVHDDEIQRLNQDTVRKRGKEVSSFLSHKSKQVTNILYQTLNPYQHTIFLKDRNFRTYQRKLTNLHKTYAFTSTQKDTLLNLIANIDSHKADTNLRLKDKKYNKAEKAEFKQKLDSLNRAWETSFSTILDATQLEKYQKTKIKQQTQGRVNQFRNKTKLSKDSLVTFQNLLIDKTYLQTYQDSIFQQKIDDLEKEIQLFLNDTQYQSYQELFNVN